jgi:hypothetical protein
MAVDLKYLFEHDMDTSIYKQKIRSTLFRNDQKSFIGRIGWRHRKYCTLPVSKMVQ